MITECVLNTNGETFITKRTVKILLALSLNIKIVSAEWLIQCILSKEIVNDSNYIAKGIVVNEHLFPFKTEKNLQKLFDKMKFHVKNGTNQMITRHKILKLIINCGGTIVETPDNSAITIVMTDKATADSNGPPNINYLYVIDCITLNEIRSTDNYR